MSTRTLARRFAAPGELAFQIALVINWVFLGPTLLLYGLYGLAVVGESMTDREWAKSIVMIGLYAGSLLGIAGLIRSRRHNGRSTQLSIEATQYCLVAGIVTVGGLLLTVGVLAARDIYGIPGLNMAYAFPAMSLGLLLADGLRQIARLNGMLDEWHWQRSNTLPLTMLAMALGLGSAVAASWALL